MEILLYASAAIAALSLLLIAIFVIKAVKGINAAKQEVADSLNELQGKLNGVTSQANELLANTNRITEDVERKLQSLNSLSKTAQKLDESTAHMNQSFQALADQISNPDPKYKDLMQKANTVTGIAASIYYRAKREKAKQADRPAENRSQRNGSHDIELLPPPQKRLPEPQTKN